MDKPFDVLVVGELNPDLVLTGDVAPAAGQVEKIIDDASLVLGSSSGIFACGAARLGLKVTFAGKTGADGFGEFLWGELRQRGIDTHAAVVDPTVRTGISVILKHGHDRTILTYLGAISELRLDEIDPALFSQARHLHIGAYFLLTRLMPDVPRLLKMAKAAGMSISLDTNYDPAEKWTTGMDQVLELVDVFLPNETEACKISGEPQLEDALDNLSRRVKLVAAKLGEQGAEARQGRKAVRVPVYPARVVDTVGAGDSFDAGFLYGWLAGWDLERCLRLGSACGSLSTRAAGGTAAQPTLDEAMGLINQK
jgi:sugar/nucleoside kinase (ribokinase family)